MSSKTMFADFHLVERTESWTVRAEQPTLRRLSETKATLSHLGAVQIGRSLSCCNTLEAIYEVFSGNLLYAFMRRS